MSTPRELVEAAFAARGSVLTATPTGFMTNCRVLGHGQGRGDHNPSLSIREATDGTVLVTCFAGCCLSDIVQSVGLKIPDLFPRACHPRRRLQPRRVVVRRERSPSLDPARMAALNAGLRDALDSAGLAHLATTLGLTVASLVALGVGWDAAHAAWSFPMRDGDGRLIGFRLRLRNGSKLTVAGTHNGLFVPDDLHAGERLLIAEGPTDTAALLDMGFQAVGRPSCSGGRDRVCRLVSRLDFDDIVIAADRDEPGQRGAAKLAGDLIRYAPVRIITPPAKDVRQWVTRDHATTADVIDLIERAPVQRLRVTVAHTEGAA